MGNCSSARPQPSQSVYDYRRDVPGAPASIGYAYTPKSRKPKPQISKSYPLDPRNPEPQTHIQYKPNPRLAENQNKPFNLARTQPHQPYQGFVETKSHPLPLPRIPTPAARKENDSERRRIRNRNRESTGLYAPVPASTPYLRPESVYAPVPEEGGYFVNRNALEPVSKPVVIKRGVPGSRVAKERDGGGGGGGEGGRGAFGREAPRKEVVRTVDERTRMR